MPLISYFLLVFHKNPMFTTIHKNIKMESNSFFYKQRYNWE